MSYGAELGVVIIHAFLLYGIPLVCKHHFQKCYAMLATSKIEVLEIITPVQPVSHP